MGELGLYGGACGGELGLRVARAPASRVHASTASMSCLRTWSRAWRNMRTSPASRSTCSVGFSPERGTVRSSSNAGGAAGAGIGAAAGAGADAAAWGARVDRACGGIAADAGADLPGAVFQVRGQDCERARLQGVGHSVHRVNCREVSGKSDSPERVIYRGP